MKKKYGFWKIELWWNFTDTTSINTNDIICEAGYYHCKESRKCISNDYLCDGRKQCWSVEVYQGTDGKAKLAVTNTGDDEDLELCKSRKAFPKEASFPCNEANRPPETGEFVKKTTM